MHKVRVSVRHSALSFLYSNDMPDTINHYTPPTLTCYSVALERGFAATDINNSDSELSGFENGGEIEGSNLNNWD
jgi:hypothetical protein